MEGFLYEKGKGVIKKFQLDLNLYDLAFQDGLTLQGDVKPKPES